MTRAWRKELHPRAGHGHGGGRFVKKLASMRTGESISTEHGVKIRAGAVSHRGRSRRLFSVEGGSVHRSAESAAAEASALGAPPTVGEHGSAGPKTHTGWLGRYRRMSHQDLLDELEFLEANKADPDAVHQPNLKVRYNALLSALAEAEGSKTKKERPGARKRIEPKPGKGAFEDHAAQIRKRIELMRKKATKRSHVPSDRNSSDIGHIEANIRYYRSRAEEARQRGNVGLAETHERHAMEAEKRLYVLKKADKGKPAIVSHVLAPSDAQEIGKMVDELAATWRKENEGPNSAINEEIATLTERQRVLDNMPFKDRFAGPVRDEIDANSVRLRELKDQRDNSASDPRLKAALAKVEKIHNGFVELLDQEDRMVDKVLALPTGSSERLAASLELERFRKKMKPAKEKMQAAQRELGIARKLAEDNQRQAYLAALKAIRPGFGEGSIKMDRAPAGIGDLFEIAAQHLPREWVELIGAKSAGGGPLTVKQRANARAHYESYNHLVLMASGTRSFSVALHEIGHAVEHTNPAIKESEHDFYVKRTGNEPLKSLSRIAPGRGYKSNEKAREDEFSHPYIGKDYGGHFYELLTMGLEGVFFNQHDIRTRDPEMTRWVLGLLAAA